MKVLLFMIVQDLYNQEITVQNMYIKSVHIRKTTYNEINTKV